MSNIEHLIENAIAEINSSNDFKAWKEWEEKYGNLDSSVKASAEEIWEIALYVTYNFDTRGFYND